MFMIGSRILSCALAAIVLGGFHQAHSQSTQSLRYLYPWPKYPWQKALTWSESEQATWVQAYLDEGRVIDTTRIFGALSVGNSPLVLPLIEKKIEQVLASRSPSDCFRGDKAADPKRWMRLISSEIAYVGSEQSLQEASKLIKLDEALFGYMVENTLASAQGRGNPFSIAYSGFGIGNPAVEKRVITWVEAFLARHATRERPPVEHAIWAVPLVDRLWAEAMVERYGGVPTEAQLAVDPIYSRLNPPLNPSFRNDLLRYAIQTVASRIRTDRELSKLRLIGDHNEGRRP